MYMYIHVILYDFSTCVDFVHWEKLGNSNDLSLLLVASQCIGLCREWLAEVVGCGRTAPNSLETVL